MVTAGHLSRAPAAGGAGRHPVRWRSPRHAASRADPFSDQEVPCPPKTSRRSSSRPVEPVGHVRVVYLGPVAPHWEVQSDFGDPEVIDAFRDRALARLVLLPPHDPQFRRNRERVVRDAERENLTLDWDLGFPEETAERADEPA